MVLRDLFDQHGTATRRKHRLLAQVTQRLGVHPGHAQHAGHGQSRHDDDERQTDDLYAPNPPHRSLHDQQDADDDTGHHCPCQLAADSARGRSRNGPANVTQVHEHHDREDDEHKQLGYIKRKNIH